MKKKEKDHLTLDDTNVVIHIASQEASEKNAGCCDRPGSTHIPSQGFIYSTHQQKAPVTIRNRGLRSLALLRNPPAILHDILTAG